MKGKISVILSAALLLGTVDVSYAATNTQKICNINYDERTFDEAPLLTSGRYVLSSKPQKPDGPSKIADSTKVLYGVHLLLGELQREGVNIAQFAPEGMDLSIVDANVPGVAGAAFLWQTDKTIYVYNASSDPLLIKSNDVDTIIHEIGHYVDFKYFTDADRQKYKEIRQIPNEYINSSSEWNTRPVEIFAEDFKYTFGRMFNADDRAKMPALTSTQKVEIKKLIIESIKRKQTVDSIDTYKQLIESGFLLGSSYNTCSIEEKDKVLKSNIDLQTLTQFFTGYMRYNGIESQDMRLITYKLEELRKYSVDFINGKNSADGRNLQTLLLYVSPYLMKTGKYKYSDFILSKDIYNRNSLTHSEIFNIAQKLLFNRNVDNVYKNEYTSNAVENTLDDRLSNLKDRGIISNVNNFRKDDYLTREEMYTLLIRSVGLGEIASDDSRLLTHFFYEDLSMYNWSYRSIYLAHTIELSPQVLMIHPKENVTFSELFDTILKIPDIDAEKIIKYRSNYYNNQKVTREAVANIIYYALNP